MSKFASRVRSGRGTVAVLAVLGSLLLLSGVSVAAIVGPDDMAQLPTSRVQLGAAKAITTTPTVLAMQHATMKLTAQAPSGRVFVGAAHPVDASDYVSAMPAREIYRLDQHGASTEVRPGTKTRAYNEPVGLDFWSQASHGTGSQSVTMQLQGQPIQAVIMPLDKQTEVTLGVGLVFAHSFIAGLVAATLGATLLVIGWLLRRRRKNGTPFGQTDLSTDPAGEVVKEERGQERVLVRGSAALAMVPLLVGCSAVPIPSTAPAWDTASLSRPVVKDSREGQAIFDDSEARIFTAWAKSLAGDKDAWDSVECGALLAIDDYYSTYDMRRTDKKNIGKPVSREWRNQATFIPSFNSYPKFLIARGQRYEKGSKPGSDLGLRVIVKQHSDQPWRVLAGLDVSASFNKLLAAPAQPVTGVTGEQEQKNQEHG